MFKCIEILLANTCSAKWIRLIKRYRLVTQERGLCFCRREERSGAPFAARDRPSHCENQSRLEGNVLDALEIEHTIPR